MKQDLPNLDSTFFLLSRKSFVILFTINVLAIVFVVVFLGYRHYQQTWDGLRRADVSAAFLLSHLIQEHEATVTSLLQSYASRPLLVRSIKNQDLSGIKFQLKALKENHQHQMDLIWLTKPDATLWMNYPYFPEALGRDLSDRDWFKGIRQTWEPYVSQIFQLIVANKPFAVATVVPILDEDKKVIGILGNSHRLGFLNQIIKEMPLPEISGIHILDRAGQILYSSRYPYYDKITLFEHFQKIQEKLDAFEVENRHAENPLEWDIDSDTQLTLKRIPFLLWTVVLEKNKKDALVVSSSGILDIAFVGLLLCFGIGMFLWTQHRNAARQKKITDQISEERQILQGISEGTSDAVYVKDTNGKYLLANSATCAFVGKGKEMFLGKDDTFLFPNDEGHKIILSDRAIMESGRTQVIEEYVTTSNGPSVFLTTKGPLFDSQGRIHGLFGIARDITDRKKAESRLIEARAAAEEANRFKDKFVGLVSHDLKNPLALIMGFLQIAQSKLKSESLIKLFESGEQGKLLQEIESLMSKVESAVVTMNLIINDLLNVSRFRIGHQKVQMKFFNASDVLLQAVNENQLLATQKGIRLFLSEVLSVESVQNENHFRIYADRSLVLEALRNLITNAIKFCKQGDFIEVGFQKSCDRLHLSVSDNGAGISEATIWQIKGVGSVASTNGSNGEKGTGLGLSLVKEIMSLHLGTLEISSTLGKGSLFTLAFPLVIPKILIVDVDSQTRGWLCESLVESAYDIHVVQNCKDALDFVAKQPPHLILADIHMPKLGNDLPPVDSLSMLEKLRENPQYKQISVILFANSIGPEVRKAVFRYGAQDFISKQTSKEELLLRVKRFI